MEREAIRCWVHSREVYLEQDLKSGRKHSRGVAGRQRRAGRLGARSWTRSTHKIKKKRVLSSY